MIKVFVVERKSDREKADKGVRYMPPKYLFIPNNDLIVEFRNNRLYVFPLTRENSSDFKKIKEVNISGDFLMDAIREIELNEILQENKEEFFNATN